MTQSLATLRLPSRPLPAGGEARAIAAGRRIVRRRRIGMVCVTGGTAAAVVAVVLVVAGGGARGDSLSTVTPAGGGSASQGSGSHGSGHVVRAVPAPTLPPGVLPTPLPTPSGLPVGVGPAPSDSPSASASPTAAAAHGPYVGFEPTEADGGPTVTRTTTNDPTFCEKNAQVAEYRHPDGWCMTLTTTAPPEGFVAGHRVSFTLEMCKAPESGAATLHFPSRMEVNLSANQVLDDGNEAARWTWDERFGFPQAAHTLTFNPGDCATWVMTWSGQDYDGYAVPQGAYDVIGWLTADEYLKDDADYPPPVTNLRQSIAVSWS
jgi:hypothetical protein